MITYAEAMTLVAAHVAALHDQDVPRITLSNRLLNAFLDQFEGAEQRFMLARLMEQYWRVNKFTKAKSAPC
jgi:hypothetical protein